MVVELGLMVVYDGRDAKLDEALTKVLEEFGYEFVASGYSFMDDQRDLSFIREVPGQEVEREDDGAG